MKRGARLGRDRRGGHALANCDAVTRLAAAAACGLRGAPET